MAKKKRLTNLEARERLEAAGIDFSRDPDELRMSDVQLVADAAREAGYRKRKDAPGSTSRMYFQFLSRLRPAVRAISTANRSSPTPKKTAAQLDAEIEETLSGVTGSRSKEKRFRQFRMLAHASLGRNEFNVEAYVGESWRKAGLAEFVGVYEYGHDDDSPHSSTLVALKGWNVDVHPDFRRQGLAAAMYDFATEAFNLKVQPGDFQTPQGSGFLKSRK